jgi:hypothetical protein
MTYKETFFFVGQSLTINHEEKNKIVIEKQLKNNTVDWDTVVKVSTGQLVFPALYCNFKRADFLHYLPEDLVQYMQHITDLNRVRNEKIIKQAKEINELLLKNNITPIFLKGTGNLLEGLYEDIAERMVGDIDFIVSRDEYERTINIVTNFEYETIKKDSYFYPIFKHYPRLHKNSSDNIAAVEIHKELLIEKYASEFNYDRVTKDWLILNNIHFLNFANQVKLTIIANQINDDGNYYKTVSLRNGYDVFLLSQKVITKKEITNLNKLFNPLNNYLAVCYEVMGKIPSLEYTQTEKAKAYLEIFYRYLNNDSLRIKHFKRTSKKLFIKERLEFIKKSFYNKEYRQYMLKRTMDKNWQQKKLEQLGLKKRNSKIL